MFIQMKKWNQVNNKLESLLPLEYEYYSKKVSNASDYKKQRYSSKF